MAVILWGKCAINIEAVTGSSVTSRALEVPTPVQNSTSLSTERGEKHEALSEGGGNEAVRFDKGKFTLEFEVRFAKDRIMPLYDVSHDCAIAGEWKITVSDADDTTAPKMIMNSGKGTYEDILDQDDGARRHYYFDSEALPTGDQITWDNIGTPSNG